MSDQLFDPRLSKCQPGELLLVPGVDGEVHHGFVNCSTNPCGLQVRFHRDLEGGVVCSWSRTLPQFEGYPGIIHGGILASLLDELMANAAFADECYFGVTTRLEIQWLKPVKTGNGVVGRAMVIDRVEGGRGVRVEAILSLEKAKIASVSRAQFFFPTAPQFLRLASLAAMPNDMRQAFVPENT